MSMIGPSGIQPCESGKCIPSLVAGASDAIQIPSGLVPDIDDTCEIDIKAFGAFVERLRDWYFPLTIWFSIS